AKEHRMPSRLSRRSFLHTAAAAGAALGTGVLLAGDKKLPPTDPPRAAATAPPTRPAPTLTPASNPGPQSPPCATLAKRRPGPARKRFPQAQFYTDFRRLVDHKGLDAVLVGTPDHVHALAALAALRNGLHVFCEKPLTHTVEEARLVAQTAAKQKRVTQMGTQIHAGDNYRRVVELVQAGAIGPIQEVHVWCGRSYGIGQRPKGSEPIPKGFHWDLWLGPAPERPFVHGAAMDQKGVYHPFNWRGWWDF